MPPKAVPKNIHGGFAHDSLKSNSLAGYEQQRGLSLRNIHSVECISVTNGNELLIHAKHDEP